MIRAFGAGLICLALAGCGAEAGGGGGAGGSGGGGGGEEGACTPVCSDLRDNPVRSICLEGSCVDVGQRDASGEIRVSSVMVYARLPPLAVVTHARAYSTTAYHPLRPDGSELRCADLLALEPAARRDPHALNVVAWHANGFLEPPRGDTIPSPLSGVPVNEVGVEYLLLSELYTGAPDPATRIPGGSLVAQGCVEHFVAPEGRYSDHQDDPRYFPVIELELVSQ